MRHRQFCVLSLTAAASTLSQMGATAAAATSDTCAASAAGATFHWLQHVDSTMDEARRLIRGGDEGNGDKCKSVFAVAAARQTAGRGTRGRQWSDGEGNVMLTVAVPTARLPVAPLTLTPLRVGTIVHAVLSRHAASCDMQLKWPNDVLLDGGKLAGTLVEVEDDYMLIGVGVNVLVAPTVPRQGDDKGRAAISLKQAGCCTAEALPDAQKLSKELADAISDWASSGGGDATVVKDWSNLADWKTPLQLRDTDETVLPLHLLPDGRLQVRPTSGGQDRALVAEYLL